MKSATADRFLPAGSMVFQKLKTKTLNLFTFFQTVSSHFQFED
jgi:hypothetical protein